MDRKAGTMGIQVGTGGSQANGGADERRKKSFRLGRAMPGRAVLTLRCQRGLDDADHFTERFAENGIVLPHFVKVTSRVVLLPELFRQRLSCFRKLREFRVEPACLCQQATKIVGFDQFPTVMDQIGFDETLRRLVQQLDTGPGWAELEEDGIGFFDTIPGQKEPVIWIVWIGDHAIRRPLRKISAW